MGPVNWVAVLLAALAAAVVLWGFWRGRLPLWSYGLALAFVVPAVWLLALRSGGARGEALRDSAAFVLAYLAMGAVFYALG